MWPLMLGGAGLQYASGLDQGTAAKLAQGQYETEQNNLNQNLMQNYNAASPELGKLGQQWQTNLNALSGASTGYPGFASGQAQGMNAANDAVAKAQAATAGYGTGDMNGGNTMNARVAEQAQNYFNPMLQHQIAGGALGAGQTGMQYGQRQAQMQYGQQEANTSHAMQDLMNKLAVQQALYGNLSQQNYNLGQQHMRNAAGVGRTGMEVGQAMQLGGAGLGAYGSYKQAGMPGIGSYFRSGGNGWDTPYNSAQG